MSSERDKLPHDQPPLAADLEQQCRPNVGVVEGSRILSAEAYLVKRVELVGGRDRLTSSKRVPVVHL